MKGNNWAVYSGKSFNIWHPDTGKYFASADAQKITRALFDKRLRASRISSSAFSQFTNEYIEDISTLHCCAPRIAFRDVTNSTNSRTIIAALLPPSVVVTGKGPVLLWPDGTLPIAREEAFLLGLLSSMILDWYARTLVDLKLSFYLFDSLPIPDCGIELNSGDPTALRVVEISARLAAVDNRFKSWAEEVGVPVGSANDPETKENLIHELDACVAYLYGLDEEDLACLYKTFHTYPDDHKERYEAVLTLFREKPWL